MKTQKQIKEIVYDLSKIMADDEDYDEKIYPMLEDLLEYIEHKVNQ